MSPIGRVDGEDLAIRDAHRDQPFSLVIRVAW